MGTFRVPFRRLRPMGAASDGFTFVEVIVTAVIVGILAAASIPVYTSYVSTQRIDTLKNIAQMTAAAANIYSRRTNTPPACATTAACVTLLGIFVSDPVQYKIEISGNTVTVTDLYHAGITPQTAAF
jgi:prepilin-type N-terminal cleavage/methylation domain-containing protein